MILKKKCLAIILAGILMFPIIANASSDSSDYELSYSYDGSKICGIGVDNGEERVLTNLMCSKNTSGDEISIATFIKNANGDTLTLESDADFYLYGGAEYSSTIVVNGKNHINILTDEHFTITGNGSLTIDGLYSSRLAVDEDGNQLYYIVYDDIDGFQHRVVDENGDDVLVVSKEEFEAMYENLKASNPDMAQIALEDLEYFINSQYEVVPETITEEWIKEHITTEMNIIYNENDSITFSNVGSVLDAENVIFESKDILDEKFTLDVTDVTSNATDELKDAIALDNKVLLLLYDISVVNENNEIVPMENGTFTIKIKLTEEMKEYDTLTAAYILDGKVVETFDISIDGEYVVFNTTHLSEYAILGENVKTDEVIENISTGDNILVYVTILGLSVVGTGILLYKIRKEN